RDHLEGRVLRPLDEDRALQGRTATYAVADLGALGHVDIAPCPREIVENGMPCGHARANALSRVCHPARTVRRDARDGQRRVQAALRNSLRGTPGPGRPHPAPCFFSYPE